MAAFFTTDDVLNAIRAGHNTIDLLAAHFEVPAASYNLRADLADLDRDRRIRVAYVDVDGVSVFAPAEIDLTRNANA
ncbi:hypothetical protein ABZY58_11310 [Micromonospora tulbaghiae]|uniref:hypothetical protein n=1 Tax=Micromonospora tulbaghiae TaxID=479978 RepID=UPI0033A0A5E0